VWGRPVGVTTALDGSLLVTDDGSNSIWRISYVGEQSEFPLTNVRVRSLRESTRYR
jgi:hypothetical protein